MEPTPVDDGTRWYHRINPCDWARVRPLAPLGDAMAWLWEKFTWGTECPCCLFTRLIILMVLCFGLGAWL